MHIQPQAASLITQLVGGHARLPIPAQDVHGALGRPLPENHGGDDDKQRLALFIARALRG